MKIKVSIDTKCLNHSWLSLGYFDLNDSKCEIRGKAQLFYCAHCDKQYLETENDSMVVEKNSWQLSSMST
jgi:hypothetical protein